MTSLTHSEALVDALANLSDVEVIKAVLDAADRKKLADSDYAYIDSEGGRHLPIADANHVRNALARFDETHFESAEAKARAKAKIDAAAKKFGIQVSKAETAEADIDAAGVFVTITKADLEFGVIYGIASVANAVDRQGDVIRPDVLRKAAWDFIANHNAANDTHDFGDIAGKFVESWFEGDAWHVGFKPADIEVAKAAAAGEFVGFSIEGEAKRVEISL